MNRELADMRKNYNRGYLVEADVPEQPISLFRQWFDEATASAIVEPNAMILATVGGDHIPSVRTVLLKELDDDGLIFYTNYGSKKAKDIEAHPMVSIVFLWKEVERQVRIVGRAEKISSERSEKYFHSRPRGSQIGAWVSPQSDIIPDRDLLDSRQKEIETRFQDVDVLPLPDFWGGYKVWPSTVEFWQGRPSRLHDRIRYTKDADGSWSICRLAP